MLVFLYQVTDLYFQSRIYQSNIDKAIKLESHIHKKINCHKHRHFQSMSELI